MTNAWTPKDTTTHQDHVIAHVLDATVLAYFVFDEVVYILLDIGFVWTIFLDGEMGLLPHPVAVSELEIDAEIKEQIKADVDLLLSSKPAERSLFRMKALPVGAHGKPCQIKDVRFFADGERRRLLIAGEETRVAIETSLATAEVHVNAC